MDKVEARKERRRGRISSVSARKLGKTRMDERRNGVRSFVRYGRKKEGSGEG